MIIANYRYLDQFLSLEHKDRAEKLAIAIGSDLLDAWDVALENFGPQDKARVESAIDFYFKQEGLE